MSLGLPSSPFLIMLAFFGKTSFLKKNYFIKATYFLEGGDPLIFSRYEELSVVNQACQASHYPNVHPITTTIAEKTSVKMSQHLNSLTDGEGLC